MGFTLFANAETEGILNKLLAPGPLMLGHKNLEGSDCLKCHEAGKGISDAKCMACHKEIKQAFSLKKGFHGINTQACITCHADHKGRQADTTAVDIKTFDHKKMTGYSLEGKHSTIKCIECHKEKRTNKFTRRTDPRFMGATSTCVSCHKKDDVHFYKGNFAKKDCNSCHSLNGWKTDVKFNHDKDTQFKLEGHHAEMKCVDCHQVDKKIKEKTKYAWPNLAKAQCLACHDNFHKQNLSAKFSGGKCTTCHTQKSWKIESFDHKITGYTLKGEHAKLDCVECHRGGLKRSSAVNIKNPTKSSVAIKKLNFTGLKTSCLSCHQDFHKFGSFKSLKMGDLNQCSKCHNETKWTEIHGFEHDVNTRFAIEGEHKSLKCTTCHLPKPADLKTDVKKLFLVQSPTYHWNLLESKTCETCHKNPHIGIFSPKLLQQKCTSCHTADGWNVTKSNSGFDHSKTRFQLTGSHKSASCSDCHGSTGKKVFKFKNADQQFCNECHRNIHTTQFGESFSTQSCSKCHSTETFNGAFKGALEGPNKFDHSTTRYSLLGEHGKLKCEECHKPTQEILNIQWPNFRSKDHLQVKQIPKIQFLFPKLKHQGQCLTCHSDFHKGQLSSNCTECHTEKSWKLTTFIHNQKSQFKLRGKHENVDCSKCHLPTKETVLLKNQLRPVVRFKPLSSTCSDCHKDPHKGSFGGNCQACHSEISWKSAKDFHKNFTLTGVHYVLDCAECHRDGKKLAGLSQQCLFCHQKDDVHNNMLPNCKACHTQHFWEASHFRHSLTRFPLRGAHRTLECADCHTNGVYKGQSSSCVTCHLKDFNGTLPGHSTGNTSCNQCHKNTFTFQTNSP